MNKSISLLLGAGFSASMGYPIGNQLNEKISQLTYNDFGVASDETLYPKENTQVQQNREPYDLLYLFGVDLMKDFKRREGNFDYEKFYDYIKEAANDDKEVEGIAKPYCSLFDKDTLVNKLPSIYNQLIASFLKDNSGRKHYEDASFNQSIPTHMGILKCMHEFIEKCIVNVHTLNHDLLFERFEKTTL